jgi:toxin ParE1/3/4
MIWLPSSIRPARGWQPSIDVAKPKVGQRIVLSPAARQDIRDILLWSIDKFGTKAAARYRALLIQCLRDLAIDPLRPGSKTRPELADNARTYHLALSRSGAEGQHVKAPRHFILYRITSNHLEIARILHDSRELTRHLPDDYRA